MPKSYRLRTELNTDKTLQVKIDQDFDYLEILSLKLRQEDLYSRFCADYGVVAGRVIANGGYGIPNAHVSIFIPLDEIDEADPIISTLYPYKRVTELNEDGYRYNLLPYVDEYQGHRATGTFPSREDVLTRKEVLYVYEKYYKYTVRTNESGDFMIVGVPLGNQQLVLDLDLSNIGEFSLTPSDLRRMGRGTVEQFEGSNFKTSESLGSLPQIVNQTVNIDVTPFWGEDDICNIGIVRHDFDLSELGIEIEPTAVFMGSILSSNGDEYLKRNCKPKLKTGRLCGMETGPGEIIAIRQTSALDSDGLPVLEEYRVENSENAIDENGTFLIDLPMNLDYVYTNEFGERVVSNDDSRGIPTKGRYRFKFKWFNNTTDSTVQRPHYLLPNIKEVGWVDNQTSPSDTQRNYSYAFSLDWFDYGDPNTAEGRAMIREAVTCKDRFYEFDYSKVYTVASFIDRFKWGLNRNRHLGIKQINDDSCRNENNPFPVNDAQKEFKMTYIIFNIFITLIQTILISFIPTIHILALLYFPLRVLTGFILPKTNPLKNITLPMLSFPDCELCECNSEPASTTDYRPGYIPPPEVVEGVSGSGILANVTSVNHFPPLACNTGTVGSFYRAAQLLSGYNVDPNLNTVTGYENIFNQFYLSPVYYLDYNTQPQSPTNYTVGSNVTLAQSLNSMNQRATYFDSVTPNIIETEIINDQLQGVPNNSQAFTDLPLILVMDSGTTISASTIMSFVNPSGITDNNFGLYSGTGLNQFNNFNLTGSSLNSSTNYVGSSVTYIKPDGTVGVVNIDIYNTQTSNSYNFTSGIEYFQVITGMTLSEAESKLGSGVSLLKKYIFEKTSQFFCTSSGSIIDFTDIDLFRDVATTDISASSATNIPGNSNAVIYFLTRGVDVYTPKQKIKYDLSKLFGETSFNGTVEVSGNYFLNVPIQPNTGMGTWFHDYKTPESHYDYLTSTNLYNDSVNNNSSLYHPSFTFVPDSNDYVSYDTSGFTFYSSIDKSVSSILSDPAYSFGSNGYETVNNELSTTLIERVEGSTYQFSNFNNPNGNGIIVNNPSAKIWTISSSYHFSGTTSNPKTTMSNSNNIVFRSDRLPTSDFEKYGFDNTINTILKFQNFALHLNRDFTAYLFDDQGSVSDIIGGELTTTNFDVSGTGQDSQEDTTVLDQSLLDQFYSCGNMDLLQCYDGFGNSFGLKPASDKNCDYGLSINRYNRMKNGCYVLVRDPFILSIPVDYKMLFEWVSRIKFIQGLCDNVIGEMFQNNWVNGSLYMIPFQKNTIYNSSNEVQRYEYCGDDNNFFSGLNHQGPVYFDNSTNNFYHRSTPSKYNVANDDFDFIGQVPSRTGYFGQNDTNLWFPTTVMELGPKAPYLVNANLDPNYLGYYVNTLKPTTYNNNDDISALSAIGILTNSVNKQQGTTGLSLFDSQSINMFFNNRVVSNTTGTFQRLFDGRITGDVAQAYSINSEYGIVPFFDGNYPSSAQQLIPELTNINFLGFTIPIPARTTIGIFYGANTVNRRLLTDGEITIGPITNGIQNKFGYSNTQEVSGYPWIIKYDAFTASLWGRTTNNWYTVANSNTGTFPKREYQGDNFNTSPSPYVNPAGGFGTGYIYNRINGVPAPIFNTAGQTNNIIGYDSEGYLDYGFKVGAPFHFYFGLKKGKTAMDRFIKDYLTVQ